MASFLRRNLFIVLGISLPLILVAVILTIQVVARSKVAPPLTPVLYVLQSSWLPMQQFEFELDDARLQVHFRVPKAAPDPRDRAAGQIEIALYDPRSKVLETFVLEAESTVEPDTAVPVELPARLERLRFDDRLQSPDGYRFEAYRASRSGVLGALFGHGSDNTRFRLSRDGAAFRLPGAGAYADTDAFIAWVVDDGGPR